MPRKGQYKPAPEIGTEFGKLTVLDNTHFIQENEQRVPACLCRCTCGNELVIRNYVLRRRQPARSCGCTRRHGHGQRGIKSRTYNAWINMKTRVRRDPHYVNVKIASAWLNDFTQFASDMGECPEFGTLDRIDSAGHYEPGNCRWATFKQQNNNRSNNRVIEHNGQSLTVQGWMNLHGLHPSTFYRRLQLGWSEKEAAVTPKLARHASWNRTFSTES